MSTILPIFLVFAVIALVVRLIAGSMDGDRLERYASKQGWTIVDRSWKPFGPGWFGSQNERLYDVTYRNGAGETRRAFVKTSALAGVYVSEDRLVKRPPDVPDRTGNDTPNRLAEVERENAALRRRLAELEARPSDSSE